MNLEKLSEKLYAQVSLQMEEALSIENALEQLKSGLSLVQNALATLRIGGKGCNEAPRFQQIGFLNALVFHTWIDCVTNRRFTLK